MFLQPFSKRALRGQTWEHSNSLYLTAVEEEICWALLWMEKITTPLLKSYQNILQEEQAT